MSTNTAAAQLGGSTIHMVAQLRRRKINPRGKDSDISTETKVVSLMKYQLLSIINLFACRLLRYNEDYRQFRLKLFLISDVFCEIRPFFSFYLERNNSDGVR